jgi:hypothetical protein
MQIFSMRLIWIFLAMSRGRRCKRMRSNSTGNIEVGKTLQRISKDRNIKDRNPHRHVVESPEKKGYLMKFLD